MAVSRHKLILCQYPYHGYAQRAGPGPRNRKSTRNPSVFRVEIAYSGRPDVRTITLHQQSMNSADGLNPYLVLGVPDFADAEQIAAAYRRLARRFHPDVSEDLQANERMQEINWAYELLSDEVKRARFDRQAYSPMSDPGSHTGEPSHAQQDGSPYATPLRPGKLATVWNKLFNHDVRLMRWKGSSAVAGTVFVLIILGIASMLTNVSLGLIVALPAAWLVALFQAASPSRRTGGLIGSTIGLVASTIACGAVTIYLSDGEIGNEEFMLSGQVLLLFAIPIAAIGGSLVGMMGDEE